MKKFLSVLLALAVAFTFTFGSSMSAFADTNTYPNANANLDTAYANALTAVGKTTYYVDYDVNNTITTVEPAESNLAYYTFTTAAAEEAVFAAYKQIESEATVLAEAKTGTDAAKQAAYYTAILDAVEGEGYKLDGSDTEVDVSDVTAAMYKKDFDLFKGVLTAAVEKVDISDYSNTNYKDNSLTQGYLSKDTERYDTSAEAALADITLAKSILNNASMSDSVTQSSDKSIAWKAIGYKELYSVVFGDAAIIKVSNNSDATALVYTLVNDEPYSTNTEEKLAGNTKANVILINKTALENYLAPVKYAELGKAGQEEYDAFKVAQTWLIENYKAPYYNVAVTFGDETNKTKFDATKTYYTNAYALVQYANNYASILKGQKNADGTLVYDAELVDEDLATVVESIYRLGTTYTSEDAINPVLSADTNKATYITSTEISKHIIDYSTVVESANNDYSITYVKGIYAADATETRAYFAKEWETVKAAIDTYNAALKNAKTDDDIDAAKKALYKATKDVKTSEAVRTLPIYDADAGNLAAYFTLATNSAKAANSYVNKIYVKFGDTWKDAVVTTTQTTQGYAVTADVKAWYIDKGARTEAEVKALTADAKAVIDAYKTDLEIKDLAAAVKAQIAALPAKVTLADKDAIQAAYDAYSELEGTGYQGLVSNASLLTGANGAIAAVKKLEKKAVEDAYKALPTVTKVTIADKEAVKAVDEAAKAYKNTLMYGTPTDLTVSVKSLLDQIQKLEAQKLYNDIQALAAKDITAADDAAVKAAREAFEAYVAEYGIATVGTVEISKLEATLAAVEKDLATALEAAEWTATDVKASLFDSSRKLTIWRTSKTSIRVTSTGSVADIKDHGYTVEYKFYKKAPGATSYKLVKTTSSNKYTYTNLKKGTNKFQVKVVVKDADGKVVASKWTYYRAAKIK